MFSRGGLPGNRDNHTEGFERFTAILRSLMVNNVSDLFLFSVIMKVLSLFTIANR